MVYLEYDLRARTEVSRTPELSFVKAKAFRPEDLSDSGLTVILERLFGRRTNQRTQLVVP